MTPWQVPSALARLELIGPIGAEVDADAARREAEDAIERWGTRGQQGPYHDGSWSRIGLLGPSGDPHRTFAEAGETREPTPVLEAMPTLRRFFETFEGSMRAAVLSRMAPGGTIAWHHDTQQSLDRDYVRLHLPLTSSPGAVTTIGHQSRHLQVGELWYGDFSFPHTVENDGPARLHVMFDVPVCESLRRRFPAALLRGRRRRRLARAASLRVFERLQRASAHGREVNAYKAERDRAIREGRTPPPPPWAEGGRGEGEARQ